MRKFIRNLANNAGLDIVKSLILVHAKDEKEITYDIPNDGFSL